mgnify:CR=1 FL=1
MMKTESISAQNRESLRQLRRRPTPGPVWEEGAGPPARRHFKGGGAGGQALYDRPGPHRLPGRDRPALAAWTEPGDGRNTLTENTRKIFQKIEKKTCISPGGMLL